MTPQTERNGHLLINGVKYRRSQFMAKKASPTIKDWLLCGLVLVGLVLSALLAACLVLLFVWVVLELVRAIGQQLAALKG